MWRRLLSISALVLALIPTLAFGQNPTVSGTVTYRDRSLLPADAVLNIQLVDLSRAGAPATVIAEQNLAVGSRPPPYSYNLPYDRARISTNGIYAVQATIRSAGQPIYRNTTAYLVLTQGRPNTADIVVTRTSGLPTTNGLDWSLLVALISGVLGLSLILRRRLARPQ